MKRILLIDASESHQFLLQEELSEEGYDMIAANSIEEALSKHEEINPNLIILELRQRDVKEENLRKLKDQYPDPPLIGYSTFTQCPDEFEKWISFYFPKSWETDGLKGLIRTL